VVGNIRQDDFIEGIILGILMNRLLIRMWNILIRCDDEKKRCTETERSDKVDGCGWRRLSL